MAIIERFLKKWVPEIFVNSLGFVYPSSLDNMISAKYKNFRNDSHVDLKFGFQMYIDYNDHVQFRYTYWDNSRWEIREFVDLVKKTDGVFIDIGANVGFFTLMFCNITDNRRSVHAFEPLKYNINRFELNLKLNNFQNVVIHDYGLSDVCKETQIAYSLLNRGAASIYAHDSVNKESIKLKKLDDIDHIDSENIGLIKLDVEGAENAVLRGGIKLLKNKSIPILLELHHRENRQKMENLIKLLKGLNYSEIVNKSEIYELDRIDSDDIPEKLVDYSHWVIK